MFTKQNQEREVEFEDVVEDGGWEGPLKYREFRELLNKCQFLFLTHPILLVHVGRNRLEKPLQDQALAGVGAVQEFLSSPHCELELL